VDNIASKSLKAFKLQTISLCKSTVLTNLVNSPEASPLHRSIRLELDPETVAGRSDWRYNCTMTESGNQRRHLTVTISNLIINKKKRNTSDHEKETSKGDFQDEAGSSPGQPDLAVHTPVHYSRVGLDNL